MTKVSFTRLALHYGHAISYPLKKRGFFVLFCFFIVVVVVFFVCASSLARPSKITC